jgi:cytidine deaminase
MAVKKLEMHYEWLNSQSELNEADRTLLEAAKQATAMAYAPYSQFYVAAVARLANGTMVAGTNQENASYPVGTCAERTLLGILANQYPGQPIDTLAITYRHASTADGANHPASPCGMCRQALLEYEQRLGSPIRLLLSGQSGPVLLIHRAADLLPFGFGPADLQPEQPA